MAAIPNPPQNHPGDLSALLAFKSHITSDPHNILTNTWTTNTSFCTWTGVSCSRRRPRVTVLELINLSLTGTIAPEIGNLTFLKSLHLTNNSFNGHLPDSFGDVVPASFGRLANLQYLLLRGNSFKEGPMPSAILNMSSLIVLDLSSTGLSGSLPSDFGLHFPALQKLYIKGNRFTGSIPNSLSNASSLDLVGFSNNMFTGSVPASIGDLPLLQCLELAGNIPSEIKYMEKLEELYLEDNRLEGSIPAEIFQSKLHLSMLSLDQNMLSGPIPSNIGNLTNLQIFSVKENSLSSAIPLSISGLKQLIFLDLSFNFLEGHLPRELGNLNFLTDMDLSSNHLSGFLPITLGTS
ncbi:putative LRR receptor-like serine/threonine-protein kinase MRH1 [Acorus calamus]|uniref:LRR receptor-like serine/threonine-protein kinase MRH1 n=1 Tax=Acorus calamus TaxID=4465 RepID=A0AAV9EL50_ACOCL|nr:putative LRR receptor-like serine/threonine-protein kinase MRH1 [Acorus calamus]